MTPDRKRTEKLHEGPYYPREAMLRILSPAPRRSTSAWLWAFVIALIAILAIAFLLAATP